MACLWALGPVMVLPSLSVARFLHPRSTPIGSPWFSVTSICVSTRMLTNHLLACSVIVAARMRPVTSDFSLSLIIPSRGNVTYLPLR